MSSFTLPLIVEVEQGEVAGLGAVRLLYAFTYDVGRLGSADHIQVPSGFVTDFASVPWWGRWLFAPFDRSAKAAVVHDYLLSQGPPNRRPRPRSEIDRIFREAMAVLEVPAWRRWTMWAAVRLQAVLRGDRR